MHNKVYAIGFFVAVLLLSLPESAMAQQAEAQKTISVSSTGVVKAKPDVSVIMLEVRATAPLAKDALQECTQRAHDVAAKLRQTGLKDDTFRFSGIQFSPAGGGRVVYPGGQRTTGFDVYQLLQVQIRDISPAKPDELNARVSSLLDDLSKAGASVLSSGISQVSLGGSSAVVFAVLEPDKYEKLAYESAIEKARSMGEEIAKKMGVKIVGINSVHSSMQPAVRNPYTTDLLDFAYYSTSSDEINIRSVVTVAFSFK
jgi:uncharacterized protein YggE